MERKNIEKMIREDWFKDHVAEFKKLSERVSTLSWGKPNSSIYYVRYVFDGCKLYVSGDTGEAVFSLTEKASIENIKNYNIGYFHGKLSAFCEDEYSFDSDTAIERIKEEIKYVKENRDINDEGKQENTDRNMKINTYISFLNRLMIESESCFNTDGWKYEIEQVYDDLTDYDRDVSKWIFNAGSVIPSRVRGYLIGLQMASEQLKDSQK